MARKESLHEIGDSIQNHRNREISNYIRNCAIARASCSLKSSLHPEKSGDKILWLVNNSWNDYYNRAQTALKTTDGEHVYKNTRVGELLTKHASGKYEYSHRISSGQKAGCVDKTEVEIFNRAQYILTANSAKEVTVDLDGRTYRYQTLEELRREKESVSEKLEALKRKHEEIEMALKAAEEAAKEERIRKQKEKEAEKARLLAERLRKQHEEDERLLNEFKIQDAELKEKLARAKAFTREKAELRSQHLLDASQEEAKRSNLYNGVPVLIEGGPGTGKTTTMIQRLNFLLSDVALREYDAPLTEQQITELANPQTRNAKWLYFSPTKELLAYLKANMANEGMRANENNTTVIDVFCRSILTSYKLNIPDANGPFLRYKPIEGEETLIINAKVAITSFECFLVKKVTKVLLEISHLQTSEFPWHKKAVSIKAYCQKAENIKDITALMNLLNSMKDNESATIKENEKRLNNEKGLIALHIINAVMKNEIMVSQITKLFDKWEDEDEDGISDESFDDDDIDTTDNIEEAYTNDFKLLLNRQTKSILRNLSLKAIDNKQKLTKRQIELYNIIKDYVDAQDLTLLGQLEWFSKKFAFPCRGIECNIFNQIPKAYKNFRKNLLKAGSTCYKLPILKKIITKNKNKHLHLEEIELLVGFINNLILGVYKKSKLRFEAMRNNKYVKAYIENAKPVIMVDEATDYSVLDYYFMASFRHYEYNSLTLCGDIMQGLNANGIESWDNLKKSVLPDLKVFELKVSYRQTPTLLEMSKRLYKDDQGKDAPYDTNMEKSDAEVSPICFISDNQSKKINWIAKRICEIYRRYDDNLPAVAILVGDEVDVDEMVEEMQDLDILNGFSILNCTNGNTSNEMKCIHIFRLSEVKGMEFEAVFFYDIDAALMGQPHKMMRRYLYVGVSRATSHLAATFTKEDGNEDIIKYFDTEKKNWR